MKRIGEVLGERFLRRNTVESNFDITSAKDQCPMCKGAGYLRVEVQLGHPFFGRAFECECLMRVKEERDFADLQRLSQLESFSDKTFDNFDRKVPGIEKVYNKARTFAEDPNGWLVLEGPFGCGKTHLAAAIAKHALSKPLRVLFTVVPDLLDHLRSTFAPSSDVQYDELFESVRATPLLILDDLGTENTTPWAGEKLYQICNYRYNERLPTVITTNRDLNDVDARIRSRMNDLSLCDIVHINAGDYRPRQRGERVNKRFYKPEYKR